MKGNQISNSRYTVCFLVIMLALWFGAMLLKPNKENKQSPKIPTKDEILNNVEITGDIIENKNGFKVFLQPDKPGVQPFYILYPYELRFLSMKYSDREWRVYTNFYFYTGTIRNDKGNVR